MGEISYAHLAATIGIGYQALKSYPKLYAIEQAAPIVRAVLLLLFYAFLPFGLVFSRYRFSTLATGSLFISSLILWRYSWQLVAWIDQALIKALYGGWLFQHSPQAVLADGVIGLLMVIAPLFWFTVMGILGVNAGRGLDRLFMGLMAPAGAAGESGGNLVTGPIMGALRFIK